MMPPPPSELLFSAGPEFCPRAVAPGEELPLVVYFRCHFLSSIPLFFLSYILFLRLSFFRFIFLQIGWRGVRTARKRRVHT